MLSQIAASMSPRGLRKQQQEPLNNIPWIKNGWFSELDLLWPGQRFALALDEFSSKSVLFHAETEFQDILVFRSAQYGNVLVLDGAIQATERDEFAYHEMMIHVPLCSHKNPRSVLIVGGGDGGALREVCQHECVTKITIVEIDPQVVHVAKTYFRDTLAAAFDDPRVEIIYQDAADFLKQTTEKYDIIIGDTSDPVGPAKSLFQPSFYESMYDALSPDGLICVQAECFWIHLHLISDLMACCDDIFDHVEYFWTMVPTYPCGQLGFIVAGKSTTRRTCKRPSRKPDFLGQLKWYSPDMHRAAFTLPPFVAAELEESVKGELADEDGDSFVEETYRCFLAPMLTRVQDGLTAPKLEIYENGHDTTHDDEDGAGTDKCAVSCVIL